MKRALLRSREIEIDPICRTLSRNGVLIQPPRKVLDLILLLVRYRDAVVSREKIEREIWAGVCVSRSSLRWLLKEARRCLGDNGTDQRYIETTRGYGLRWVADVERVECGAEATEELQYQLSARAFRVEFCTEPDRDPESVVRCTNLIRIAENQLRAGKFNEARDALRSAAEAAERIADCEKPNVSVYCQQSPVLSNCRSERDSLAR